MDEVRNGIPAPRLRDAVWRKSSRSGARGNCVEIANLPGGVAAIRNSRNPSGPALVYTRDQLDGFLTGTKHGESEELQS
ncbi:uncharacterized protein DUF397 [Tamaricihabitans halophyticus]|uniref:Uncharacterized protein DUF397 n=1 Tax=Tamaricihabitans halophyticus TaxID=1262583 RepID=A0A4R2QQQ9_9PSEU|nr:DUF397 domain-containing protein [Tamaricihabitans halophyticus]TCP49365.1 uncharacterized protein DUF397 [Tamaricihabitans halophyticus]